MNIWFTDPRTLAVLGGALSQLVIAVWTGKQTAQALADMRRWRDESLTPWRSGVDSGLAELVVRVETTEREIERLRDRRAKA